MVCQQQTGRQSTADSATQSKGDRGDPDIQARLIAEYESLQEQQLQMVVQKQFDKYMPRNTLALSVERDKPTLSRQDHSFSARRDYAIDWRLYLFDQERCCYHFIYHTSQAGSAES